jgi:glucose-1-phosphate cytidylyltransferase
MKVIILCGGRGMRLREETEYKPKPMVEIGGKPILWHIMKLYAHYGYKDFILALGYKGDIIRNYFLNYRYYNNDFTIDLGSGDNIRVYDNHGGYDWKVTLAETGPDSMTGYRVKMCEKYITEEKFMLTYGDAVSNVNITELVNFHKNHGKIGTITGVFPPSRFGDLTVAGDLVEKFKEKPKDLKHNPINGGFFIFKKEFLSMIPSNPSCDLEKEPLENLAKHKNLAVYKHYDFWQCMDTYRDFVLLNDLWENNPQWRVWE